MDINLTLRPKNKGWQYLVSYKQGKTWRQRTRQGFKTRAEAKRAGTELIKRISEELAVRTDEKYSFKQVSKMLIDGAAKPNTARAYEQWLKAYKDLEEMSIPDITYIDVASVLDECCQNHSSATNKRVHWIGKRVLDYAMKKLNLITRNPFDQYEVKTHHDATRRQPVALTVLQMDSLISKLSGPHKLLAALMAYAGLRIGEARGLTRGSVDLKERCLTITQQRLESGTIGPPKSKHSYRKVPMSTKLINVLAEYPIPLTGFLVEDLIVSDSMKKHFRKAGFDITSHDLRHSYATYCIQVGLDFRTIAQLLGDTVQVTMQTYSHVNDDMYKKAFDLLASN